MRFTPQKIDSVIDKIKNNAIKIVLLYGPDAGLIEELYKKISRALPCNTRSVSYSEMAEVGYYSVLANLNLFSEREIVKISEVPNFIDAAFWKEIERSKSANILVFIAKEPAKNSSIRKLFDTCQWAASIGCYASENIWEMIQSNLSGYFIDQDAKQYLIQHLALNHHSFLKEIEKLKIFFSNKRIIGIKELQLIVSCTPPVSLDEIFIALAEQNFKKYLEKLRIAKQNAVPDILIIRSLIRYYLNLASVLQSEQPLAKAISELDPQVFFKYLEPFSTIANSISKKTVMHALNILYQTEKILKSGPSIQLLESLYIQLTNMESNRFLNLKHL